MSTHEIRLAALESGTQSGAFPATYAPEGTGGGQTPQEHTGTVPRVSLG